MEGIAVTLIVILSCPASSSFLYAERLRTRAAQPLQAEYQKSHQGRAERKPAISAAWLGGGLYGDAAKPQEFAVYEVISRFLAGAVCDRVRRIGCMGDELQDLVRRPAGPCCG
ncbi:MAG: hypothetical protein K0S58_2737 [Nitrospira sp.]|nr:hypothetical protein [Nitrospira sp.]